MGYCISANQVGERGELWAIRGYAFMCYQIYVLRGFRL